MREIEKAIEQSDVYSAAEFFSELPHLKRVKVLHSLFVCHSQEEAKSKRVFEQYDISRGHFHEIPVRRVFVEIADEEREVHTREKTWNGKRLVAEKMHVCHSGRKCSS